MEGVLQGCDNGSSALLPFPPFRSRPLIAGKGSGERFSGSGRTAEPGRQTVFGEFQAKKSRMVATIFRSFSRNKTSNWGTRWPSGNILCASKLFGHHNGMEGVLKVCGNRSSPLLSLPFLSLPLEVGPLLQLEGLGERF